MGNSFHAAMDDLVADDASRMSGARFADARGASIARRVRTRRTVKAAGVGGASVVAVGALAVGATQAPWRALDPQSASPEPAIALSSPFECGFVMDSPVHTSRSVEVKASGLTTVSAAEAATQTVTAPGHGSVPFVEARGLHDPDEYSAGVIGDPSSARGGRGDTAIGVGVVLVESGVVVGTQDANTPLVPYPVAHGLVDDDGVSVYVVDPAYFSTCPGVASLEDAVMYAVAGSITFGLKSEPAALAYAWQPLTSP
ncbi:hypothetical protein LGT39_11305 [Demequina sp. TTPB684]|uniref:hypothetical protein n=1 Tax=unclassified Demequina TaxID=2620311 RepID=UPI001CF28F96|nr:MULTISPECIES: hypothetical protein [unclassified Demequina]MCB2413431.1 hypothetical protein [Demequina sp. TTPB684]UPU87994.1 hypothetical protein LGT36_012195 [Demequina sp. TMPB413]